MHSCSASFGHSYQGDPWVQTAGAQLEEIRQVLAAALPWVRILPDEAVDEFASEFVAVARVAVTVKSLAPVAQLLIEWRHTAEVYADPELYATLSQPHDGDFGPVSSSRRSGPPHAA